MNLRQDQSPAPAELALETVREWTLWLTDVERRVRPSFTRREARCWAGSSLRGLLSPAAWQNGWQLAEGNGDDTPYGVQHLLGRAQWDAEAVRDDLRATLIEALGEPQAVLVLDETGFVKTGQPSAGVACQYSGTAGHVDHCQIGVFLAYTSTRGHALLDRERYVPRVWTEDHALCPCGDPCESSVCDEAPTVAGDARTGLPSWGPSGLGDGGESLWG